MVCNFSSAWHQKPIQLQCCDSRKRHWSPVVQPKFPWLLITSGCSADSAGIECEQHVGLQCHNSCKLSAAGTARSVSVQHMPAILQHPLQPNTAAQDNADRCRASAAAACRATASFTAAVSCWHSLHACPGGIIQARLNLQRRTYAYIRCKN